MSYREKIEKYKKNQLTEEERKSVENEIEKAEAINEYLTEQLENDPIFENRVFEGKTENDLKCDIRNSQEGLQFEKYVKNLFIRFLEKWYWGQVLFFW